MKLSTHDKKIRPLVIFGPTAVGKTSLICSLFNSSIELISADSMQMYKGASIGTAKPTQNQRLLFTHHLVDFLEPTLTFPSGQFVLFVNNTVKQIISRNNLPLISGGSAYYLKQYIQGPSVAPKTNMNLALALTKQLKESDDNNKQNGPSPFRQELYCQLQEVDPKSAKKIHINDSYRLVRAIECYRTNGIPLSAYQVSNRSYDINEMIVVGIKKERNLLYDTINKRVDKMISMGLVDEVISLIKLGYDKQTPLMRGIGYQEFLEYPLYDNHYKQDDLDKIIEKIKQHSRNYAKKQLTFFSSIDNVFWFDANETNALKKFLIQEGYEAFLQ